MTKPIGRPKKSTSDLSKEIILRVVLELIDQDGEDAVSFRIIAKKLGVTPMAVSYHVGNRSQMMRDVIEIAFHGLSEETIPGTPSERLRALLVRYCDLGIAHANLIKSCLSDPTLMTEEFFRFNKMLKQEVGALNDGDEQDVMFNLIVDYTHGFILSFAVAPSDNQPDKADFLRSIEWLLCHVLEQK